MAIKALGSEILVNTYTNNAQGDAAIDANPLTGGFQIVWESEGQDGDGLGVYGQNFNRNGSKDGGEFGLSQFTVGDQENPDVAFNENGEGSWVWQTDAAWSTRNINRDDVPFADDFPADNLRTHYRTFGFDTEQAGKQIFNYERVLYGHTDPFDAGHDAVEPHVISIGGDQFASGYFLRNVPRAEIQYKIDLYSADTDGINTDGHWSRNYMDNESGVRPAVTAGDLVKIDDSNILAVATLATDYQNTGGVIQFQVFQSYRNRPFDYEPHQGLAFNLQERVVLEGSGLTGPATEPRVVMLNDGGFAITWQEQNQSAANSDKWHSDVYAQIFNDDFTARSAVITVDAATGSDQSAPEISTLKDGGFIIAWADSKGDGKGAGIEAQRFDENGVKLGNVVDVNATTRGDQLDPALTTLKNGHVVVTWESDYGDGNDTSVMAQKLQMLNYGNATSQILTGTSQNEIFRVGKGNDKVDGGAGNDVIHGEKGNDRLIGGAGKDKLYGEAGNDKLLGGSGLDRLFGGAGKDRLDGGKGDDFLRGNGGEDNFVFQDGNDVILDFVNDVDTVTFARGLGSGSLTKAKLGNIVDEGTDSLTFDFGHGDKLVIDGISSFAEFRDDIAFIG